MTYFIYKCYYILFLYYEKQKSNIVHESAILAMVLVTMILIILVHVTLVDVFDLYGTILSPFNDQGLSKAEHKGRLLLFIIPLIIMLTIIIRYVIITRAKVSKETGRSEIYTFEPTKRDKINYYIFFILSISSVFIARGIKYLLENYD